MKGTKVVKMRIGRRIVFLVLLFILISCTACQKEQEEIAIPKPVTSDDFRFPKDDNFYPERGYMMINGKLYGLAGIGFYEYDKEILRNGTTEIEPTKELEIFLPRGNEQYHWVIEESEKISVEESTVDLKSEELKPVEGRTAILQKFKISLHGSVNEIVFRRMNSSEEIPACDYQMTIVMKTAEELAFPRKPRNYPDSNVIKVNGVVYTMPNQELAANWSDGIVAYGTIEIERQDTLEIYVAQGDDSCVWKIEEKAGLIVEETLMNLKTESDLALSGSSWTVHKYRIKVEEDVDEIRFKHFIERSEGSKVFEEIEVLYQLTIKMKR